MTIGAIIQARMTSRRLPGKVLREVAGRPLLQYVVERLERCQLESIVVATSIDREDDTIARWCAGVGVECHRGPLDNVAQRFTEVLDKFEFDAFVRVCGDSPLLDPALVDRAVTMFRERACDVVTNVMPRTFPPGQSVEVVDAERFRSTVKRMAHPADTEHVTSHFYRQADRYCIVNFAAARSYGDARMVVDTLADFQGFAAIVAAMDRPHWTYGLDALIDLAGPRVAASGESAMAAER